MHLFTNINYKDSLKIAREFKELHHVNLKNLTQTERALCLVALQNCIYERKPVKVASISHKSIESLKLHLHAEPSAHDPGFVLKLLRPIISLVKGILNLTGLRISSRSLQNMAAQYHASKTHYNLLSEHFSSLIHIEEQKIAQLKKEIIDIKEHEIVIAKQTLNVLKEIKSKTFEEAKAHLIKAIEHFEKLLAEAMVDGLINALKTNLIGLEEHKNCPNHKSLQDRLKVSIREYQTLIQKKFPHSIHAKELQIPKIEKDIVELKKQHELLKKKHAAV